MAGIDEPLRAWIASQDLFFVASAPAGRPEVAPKGPIGALAVLDTHTVAYLDLDGEGQAGALAIMLCAFDGPARVVTLHGQGRPVGPGSAEHAELRSACDFDTDDAPIVVVEVQRVAEAAGHAVPLMDYRGERRDAAGVP